MGKLNAWSPTTLGDYESCPAHVDYKKVQKLCPRCFKGRLTGGYDAPLTCLGCGSVISPGPALVRGSRLGLSLERYVNGTEGILDGEIKNKKVRRMADEYRELFKKGQVDVELMVTLDNAWALLEGAFPPGAWFRGKLDLLHRLGVTKARVVDWKSGGIDKRTQKIRAQKKYDDQLNLYSIATLILLPKVKLAESALVFIDAPGEPVVEKPECNLKRAELPAAIGKFKLRVAKMMDDNKLKPTPSTEACRFCDYSIKKGGPCGAGL